MRAALVSDVGRINGADQAYYRVHRDSMMRTRYSDWLADLAGRRDAFAAIVAEQRKRRPVDAGQLDDMMRRRLAVEALTRAKREYHRQDRTEAAREFAAETYPGAADLRAWAALERVIRGG